MKIGFVRAISGWFEPFSSPPGTKCTHLALVACNKTLMEQAAAFLPARDACREARRVLARGPRAPSWMHRHPGRDGFFTDDRIVKDPTDLLDRRRPRRFILSFFGISDFFYPIVTTGRFWSAGTARMNRTAAARRGGSRRPECRTAGRRPPGRPNQSEPVRQGRDRRSAADRGAFPMGRRPCGRPNRFGRIGRGEPAAGRSVPILRPSRRGHGLGCLWIFRRSPFWRFGADLRRFLGRLPMESGMRRPKVSEGACPAIG